MTGTDEKLENLNNITIKKNESGKEYEYEVCSMAQINIILGKSGAGKSTFFRNFKAQFKNNNDVIYIPPERGGSLASKVHTDDSDFSVEEQQQFTKKNQAIHYKEYVMKRLVNMLYRDNSRLAKESRNISNAENRGESYEPKKYSGLDFQKILDKINSHLDYIQLYLNDNHDNIVFKSRKEEDTAMSEQYLSSGESQFILLASRFLLQFFNVAKGEGRQLIFLFDEPDLHMHPDLQVAFTQLICNELAEFTSTKVFIATHSTAIISALKPFRNNVGICFLNARDKPASQETVNIDEKLLVQFEKFEERFDEILPVFGAHPLTQIFNEKPVLLVEGQDDVDIWNQAVRSSNGKLNFYPCDMVGKGNNKEFRKRVSQILDAVYSEKARAYSLLDKDDDDSEDSHDIKRVTCLKLSCREAENLLLTDTVLADIGTNWDSLQQTLEKWLNKKEIFLRKNYDDKNDKFVKTALRHGILSQFSKKNRKYQIKFQKFNTQTKEHETVPKSTKVDQSSRKLTKLKGKFDVDGKEHEVSTMFILMSIIKQTVDSEDLPSWQYFVGASIGKCDATSLSSEISSDDNLVSYLGSNVVNELLSSSNSNNPTKGLLHEKQSDKLETSDLSTTSNKNETSSDRKCFSEIIFDAMNKMEQKPNNMPDNPDKLIEPGIDALEKGADIEQNLDSGISLYKEKVSNNKLPYDDPIVQSIAQHYNIGIKIFKYIKKAKKYKLLAQYNVDQSSIVNLQVKSFELKTYYFLVDDQKISIDSTDVFLKVKTEGSNSEFVGSPINQRLKENTTNGIQSMPTNTLLDELISRCYSEQLDSEVALLNQLKEKLSKASPSDVSVRPNITEGNILFPVQSTEIKKLPQKTPPSCTNHQLYFEALHCYKTEG